MHLFDRRRIGVVLAVVAALAVVALAARDDHTRDGGWRVPSTVTGTTQATLVILFGLLAVGVGVLTVWALLPDGRPKLEPRKLSWLRIVSSLAVMVLLFVALANGRRDTVDEQPDRRPGSGLQGGSPGSASSEGSTPEWGLGLLGAVVLVGTAAVVAYRRGRAAPLDLRGDPPIIATEEERADAVAVAHACTDPRQSVLLAFAAAEAVLSTDPATRRPPSTSAREWAAALRLPPLSDVVARYEIARFSHHAVTDDDRRAALDALERLR